MIVDDFFMFRSRARKSGLILRFVEGQPVILILISQQNMFYQWRSLREGWFFYALCAVRVNIKPFIVGR